MKLVFTDEARDALNHQIRYIAKQGSPLAAERQYDITMEFLSKSLTFAPGTGRYIEAEGFWEIWIPRTKFIVWYKFDRNTLIVGDLWHTSQNRFGTAEEDDS